MSQDKIVIYGHQASRASRPDWPLREYGMNINEDFIEVDTGGPVTGFNEVRDSEAYLTIGQVTFVYRWRQARLVGRREELGRPYQPPLRMLPADIRLEAANLPC